VQARGDPVQLVPPRLPDLFLLRQPFLQLVLAAAQLCQLDPAGLQLAVGRGQLGVLLYGASLRPFLAFRQLDPLTAVALQRTRPIVQA